MSLPLVELFRIVIFTETPKNNNNSSKSTNALVNKELSKIYKLLLFQEVYTIVC